MRPSIPRGLVPPGRRRPVTRRPARRRPERLSPGGGRSVTGGSARRSSLRGDIGALTLSYVIVFPVFLVGIMTIVQVSVWYLARQAALAAARHGADVARTASPPPGSGAAAAVAFATSAASGVLLSPRASVRIGADHTVTVTVTGRAPSLVPGLPLNVSEVVTAPVERFVATGPLTAPSWRRR